MTAPTLIAAIPRPAQLDLDARLALVDAVMDERLNVAAVAFAVNTAHLPAADPIPDIAEIVPLTPTLAPTPSPYSTPLAALLHRARVHIETHGWLQGALRQDDGTARCPIGAIRIQAGTRRQADDACTLLLDVIQQDHADAHTIPQWNDRQTSPAPVLSYLNRAAGVAHARGI